MRKDYYNNTISDFIKISKESILGQLLIEDKFNTEQLQKDAWSYEIDILKDQLINTSDGYIVFEYTIPRIGDRIDVVLLIKGIIFVLEFKVHKKSFLEMDEEQVVDYALDLKYFHEESEHRYIVPILVATDAKDITPDISIAADKVLEPLYCNAKNIAMTINTVLSRLNEDKQISANAWINSRYMPTPTIIEAAQALYQHHDVKEISRNEAGAENLENTNGAVNFIIDHCKEKHKKAICFITGVPGAGKTLAGLNIANTRQNSKEGEHAVFLSGNGPLVDVLQEALARDAVKHQHISKGIAKAGTKQFIQIIHHFRDEALDPNNVPAEKVAIFDEAQRAWDEAQLSNFMQRKKNQPGYCMSEPHSLIEYMNRHKDWATIVCLIGGGQEINTGEGGLRDWFIALKDYFPDWEIYISNKISDYEYVGDSSLDELLKGHSYNIIPELHLGVNMRSFRSEKLSDFVKALIDNRPQLANALYNELKGHYPIVITRDLLKAKDWVRNKSRGTERYGLMASSAAERLRARGIWASNDIKPVKWFLEDKRDVDSSYQLEVTATEFAVQGLEIDYGIVAWDGDFRYNGNEFEYKRFSRNIWCNVNLEQRKKYLKNAYRVLLTRSRQGLVIYVPEGNVIDPSTKPEIYDYTYNYLKSIGIEEI